MTELAPFANEPVLELRRAAIRDQLAGALEALDAQLPVSVPVTVGGDRRSGQELASTDPGRPDRVVANASAARESEVASAVAEAVKGHQAWSVVPAPDRARALLQAAAWLRERRLELAALEVRECAKPWPEADGDVCEAIDFLEYYARAAVALDVGAPFLGDLCPRRELDDYRIDAGFHRPSIARSCAISRRQKSRAPAAGCGTTKSPSDAVCVS